MPCVDNLRDLCLKVSIYVKEQRDCCTPAVCTALLVSLCFDDAMKNDLSIIRMHKFKLKSVLPKGVSYISS